MTGVQFRLRACENCLRLLDAAVRGSENYGKEQLAFEAGAKIARGSNEASLLSQIADWKSPRRKALLKRNSSTSLRVALDVARIESIPSVAILALCRLEGVGIPMASAILTAIRPKEFTVIDVRALNSLGLKNRTINKHLYSQYLEFCLRKSQELGMSLRSFDRALWKLG